MWYKTRETITRDSEEYIAKLWELRYMLYSLRIWHKLLNTCWEVSLEVIITKVYPDEVGLLRTA